MNRCPGCGRTDLVLAGGDPDSRILIIGDEPDEDSISEGRAFRGGAGRILKSELGRLGFSIYRSTYTNLWLHPNNGKEECFNYGLEELLKHSKGKELILLLGSEVVEFFTGQKVSEVSGLIVESSYFSGKVMACPKPASAFFGTIGELRLSLEKFMKQVEKLDVK